MQAKKNDVDAPFLPDDSKNSSSSSKPAPSADAATAATNLNDSRSSRQTPSAVAPTVPTNFNDSSPVLQAEPAAKPRPAAEEVRRPQVEEGGRQAAIEVDDSNVNAGYANFCRVSSTPEELILDLGLNPQPMNPETTKVKVSQRIIMNHYTAKRLLAALSMTVQRHESAFGVLETDVRRRVRGA